MSLSLGLTKGFDILSFMTDLFETTTSIRKLSKKYGVDSKILHMLGQDCIMHTYGQLHRSGGRAQH